MLALRPPWHRAATLGLWLLLGLAIAVGLAWLSGVLFYVFSGYDSPGRATPLTIYSYLYWHGPRHPSVGTYAAVSGAAAIALVGLPAAALAWPQKRSLHGDARFARHRDLARAGLLSGRGLILGEWRGQLIRHNAGAMVSPHVYLAAPTGSGKTQSIILPNVFDWPDSLIVLDIKGELYQATAGHRAAHGHRVFRLDLGARDQRTHQYNPFTYVDTHPNFITGDIEKIADYLVQTEKEEPFWANQARQLFIGLALYFFGIGEVPTVGGIRALLLTPEGLMAWTAKLMKDRTRLTKLHPECLRALKSFASSAENTAPGIRDTLAAALKPLVNELTAQAMSGNSFDLRTLRSAPTSIYVVVQPPDRAQLAPILRLFFQQAVDQNTRVEFGKDPAHRHRVLLAMDEFASIGRVPAILDGITFIRSYGLQLLAIVQSPAQLVSLYHKDGARVFSDNFGAAIFFTPAPRDLETAEEISKMLGFTTIKVDSNSRKVPTGLANADRSVSTSQQRRALMLAQEVAELPNDQAIVRIGGLPAVRAHKLFAAKDKRFTERTQPPPVIEPLTAPSAKRGANDAPVPKPGTHSQSEAAPPQRHLQPEQLTDIDPSNFEDYDQRTAQLLAAAESELTLSPNASPEELDATAMRIAMEVFDAPRDGRI